MFDEKYVFDGKEATSVFLQRRLYNAAPPTKLVKRELYDNFRFVEHGKFEDVGTTYKFFAHANRVAVHGLPKYTFVRHNRNNSSTAINHKLINNSQLLEYILSFKERTEYITALYPDLFPLARYSELSYMISMVDKIHINSLFKECFETRQIMIETLKANRRFFLESEFLKDFEKDWFQKYVV
jgi:hypothetical protein